MMMWLHDHLDEIEKFDFILIDTHPGVWYVNPK